MEMTDKKTEIEPESLSSVAGGEEELKEIRSHTGTINLYSVPPNRWPSRKIPGPIKAIVLPDRGVIELNGREVEWMEIEYEYERWFIHVEDVWII